MPVAINHVYNANDKANNDFGMGYGWRSNYNQLVYQWSTDSSYYVWEDEDATRHYFKYKSSGTYEDETNPTLTLTTTGSGTTKYCITDKNGNKSYFDTNGRLTKINNNQAAVSSITITYSSGKQIASITDGAGRKYQFNYSGAMLSSISFLGTGTSSLATESYTYSGNELTGISSTLLSSASFSYTSNHLLSQAEDAGGYRLAYLYNTTSSTKPNRVIQISEHDGNTDGDVLCIYYAHKQTIFTDSNNNQEVKQFNNYGSTVSIQDGQGKAQFYKYKSNNDVTKASQLALSSKLQNTVVNKIRNSSFEQAGFWTAGSGNASTGSWSYTSTGYIGSKSLAISRTSSSGTIRVDSTQAAYCPANSSYTLSAYVKTTGMSGGGLGAQLVLMSSGNVIASSAPITTNTDWTRVEVTYTNTTGSDISDLTAGMRNGTSGTAYFDCVQLEASANASRYNLVDNGDFSYNSSLGWNKNSACTSADGSSSNYYRAPALNDSCLYNVNEVYFDGIQLFKEEFGHSYVYDSNGTQVVAYTYDAWGNPLTTTGTMAGTLGKLNPFRYRGYVYDTETGLYYLGSRYYNPETGRFINADNSISNSFESVHGYNLFAYCFNNPVNMNDSSGSWPKWLEKVAKVVAVAAIVVTAAIVVAVATAGTGGLGSAAAGVAFGTACGGLVGGVANERKGKSFINGWAGGAVNGFTQSLGTVTLGPAGTIIGGSDGSGAGTFITESLNNTGLPNGQRKSSQEIVVEAINASIIGAAMSAITAGIGYSVDFAQGPHGYNSWAGTLLPNVGIAPITPGFGEMLKGFLGVADDAMAYRFCE